MQRLITIILFLFITSSIFGQVRKGEDGLYYDAQGNIFSGTSIEYYSDSVVQATIEIKDGKLDGLTKIYFNNGELEEIRSYSNGMMHGKWEKWNRQSVRIAEANYSENKKEGKWFVWDDNGVLRYDMTYRNGEKTGVWLMYDESGKLINSKQYN